MKLVNILQSKWILCCLQQQCQHVFLCFHHVDHESDGDDDDDNSNNNNNNNKNIIRGVVDDNYDTML